MARVLIFLVRFYQLAISPLIGPHCRFYPTCSQYTIDAIKHHGPVAGIYMAVRRLSRCHPWHPGGFDPVPTEKQ